MAVVLVTVPVTYPGRPAFTVGPLDYSVEGLTWCAVLVLKANAIVLALTALLGTVELFELGHAFQHLRVPDKLIHLFMFTLRYLDVLHHEYESLLRAMKARAFRPRMSRRTYASYANLFAMLLVRSLERSERIMAAMKCRGFRGRFYVFRHFEFHRRDLIFGGVSIVVLAGLAIMALGVR
jgi:cobalt/nickel transport system permease protein